MSEICEEGKMFPSHKIITLFQKFIPNDAPIFCRPGVVGILIRGQTDYERYTWKGATYALPNTKHSLPNME